MRTVQENFDDSRYLNFHYCRHCYDPIPALGFRLSIKEKTGDDAFYASDSESEIIDNEGKGDGQTFKIDQEKTPISKIVMIEEIYNKINNLAYFELKFMDWKDKPIQKITSHPDKEAFLDLLNIESK